MNGILSSTERHGIYRAPGSDAAPPRRGRPGWRRGWRRSRTPSLGDRVDQRAAACEPGRDGREYVQPVPWRRRALDCAARESASACDRPRAVGRGVLEVAAFTST